MSQTPLQVLKRAQFYTDGLDYLLLSLPKNRLTTAAGIFAEIGQPFGGLIFDKDEVTFILSTEDFQEYNQRLQGATASRLTYRLITIDIVLEDTLVGFMALITKALAESGISVIPMGAFSRDHLLVPTADSEKALQALEKLHKMAQ